MTNFEKYKFDLDAAARAFTARCRTKDCYRMCLQLQNLPEVVVVKECLKKWLQQEVEEKSND
jgi:hypothetical protein